MKNKFSIAIGALVLIAIAAMAYLFRTPEEASAPIEAQPVELADASTAEPTAGSISAQEETAASEEVEAVDSVGLSGTSVYVIAAEESEVRFSIDELLRNVPTTAVGITNQVAGEIAVNYDNPSESQVGIIQVNARTLETDNRNRNRMIQNEILDTAEFEFITFTPTSFENLPDAINPGEQVSFLISGDLTIRQFTAPITFEVSASIDPEGRLIGYAAATVLRADYDLRIPSVPNVADVSEEIIVEFDFVALEK